MVAAAAETPLTLAPLLLTGLALPIDLTTAEVGRYLKDKAFDDWTTGVLNATLAVVALDWLVFRLDSLDSSSAAAFSLSASMTFAVYFCSTVSREAAPI